MSIKATIDGNVYENVNQITASDGTTTKTVTLTEIIEGGGNSSGLTPMFSADFEVSELNFGNIGTGNVTGSNVVTLTFPNGTFPQEGRLYLVAFILKNPVIEEVTGTAQLATMYPIEYWSMSVGTPTNRVDNSQYPIVKLNAQKDGLFYWSLNQNYRPYIDTVIYGRNPTALNISYRLSGQSDNRYKMQAGTWTLKIYDITDIFMA